MTDYQSPSPYVISTNHDNLSYGDGAWALFDRSPSTIWHNGGSVLPSWVKVDMGLGNEKVINKYRLQSRTTYDDWPRDWKIEGSNDDSYWVLLHSVDNSTWVAPGNNWSQWYYFNNGDSYRY